ncbi:hypothetical protein [Roseisolibacter agri]|uniref:Uncharacterized protein n=1 Tax=Roseisolibacter agri TaxID=2014610 RepID=A0AA37V9P9_9BACT|nr:hypothetical protein [Roseisolibacter agri]GLC24628.1 hypothetical protein rosag_11410 [Roseisolibacter agri]
MPDPRLTDESYLWTTPNLDAAACEELEAQNLASLRRKITFCESRPEERVQFQRVEGWTTGHIIGYMRGSGLPLARIRRDLAAAGRYADDSEAAT